MIRLMCTIMSLLALCVGHTLAQNESADSKSDAERPELLDGFDDYVQRIMDEWHIPGLAIGVVHEGEVVYAKAFGQRDLQRQLPVTTATLFPIGSITKSFTATGLGMLVDEGKLDWDTPIQNYLPEFRLHDEWTSSRVTMRDLLAHRTGVPPFGMIWWGEQNWLDEHIDRQDILRAMVHIRPTSGLRQRYQYSNENYIVAGLLFEAVDAGTWEQFTQQRILDPLEMTSTHLHIRDIDHTVNLAHGHRDATGEGEFLRSDPHDEANGFYGGRALGPAGTIVSNVPDMLEWLQFHLNHGMHEGQQLLSVGAANEMVRPLVQLPDVDPPEHVGGFYGMGFQIFADSARKKWIKHTGSLSNCGSFIGFMPAENSGIVILTNWSDSFGSASPLHVIATDFKRRILGQHHRNLIRPFREIDISEIKKYHERHEARDAMRRSGTEPTHPLQDYTGTYHNTVFRTFEIYLEDGQLKFRFHGRTGTMTHFHYDTFTARLGRGSYLPTFHTDRSGQINRMLIDLEAGPDEIEFVRTSPPHLGDSDQTTN